jgi:Fe-S-cluster containining protein
MEILHAMVDIAVDNYLDAPDQITPTCGRGCHGCCYQLVGTTAVECIPIAATCLANPSRFSKDLDELKVYADIVQDPGMDTVKWFLTQYPCTFLDREECRIYKHRPISCRTLQVIGDPTGCYPEQGLQKVQFVDFSKVNKMAFGGLEDIAAGLNLPHEFHAPFPVAMLWATRIVTQGLGAFRDALRGTLHMDRNANIAHWARLTAPEHEREVKENELHTETAPGGATPVGQA